ncbi:hypothetical protein RDI58_013383 [Solanum bulbocastanum]|uniref:Uncharacterized protein n=1 Tax=Solanum bulbocastanum TaxID=147425 RepID=A0AAN8YHN9_SOLBU
MNPNIAETIL